MALKKNRLTIAMLATAVAMLFAACGVSAASPTSTPVVAPTSTPVPINAISIDPKADPDGFLAALPSSEVDCAASAVGGHDRLRQLVSQSGDNTDGISTTQLRVLASCVGNDTVKRIVLGQLELEVGGLTDETVSCVTQYTDGIDFSSLFGGYASGQDTVVSTLQALFCLNAGERQALESSDQTIIELTELGGIDALECAVDGAGPTGLAEFGNIFDADGTVDPLAVGKFMPLLIDCGVVDEEAFTTNGVTAEQFACLFQELDPETLASFLAIANNTATTPDLSTAAELLSAMGKCGLDLQAILDAAGSGGTGSGNGTPTPSPAIISTDLLLCLSDNGVNATLASNYAVGTADASDPTLVNALAICLGNGSGSEGGLTIPDGNGGTTTIDSSVLDSLPITTEQAQCLIDEVGIEQLQGVAAGTTSPLAILGALGACDISITDLIAS